MFGLLGFGGSGGGLGNGRYGVGFLEKDMTFFLREKGFGYEISCGIYVAPTCNISLEIERKLENGLDCNCSGV